MTSDLGGHGADVCASPNAKRARRRRTFGRRRRYAEIYQGLGFLAWDPRATKAPPGSSDILQLMTELQAHVGAVGEAGCHFESQLEAWYRFLSDPEPPGSIERDRSGQFAVVQGVDDLLLEQRKAFLRPASAVAILMLSDENDCSMTMVQVGWLSAQSLHADGSVFHLPRSTQVCDSQPNHP